MALVKESFSPKELDEVFSRPPLREVAFEIRFAPRLRVNAELWKIQDEIVGEYPQVGTEPLLQPGAGSAINVFQNSATGRVLKVSQENFVVAFTKYSRFEDFKEEVLKRTEQFCSKFDVSSLLRVGLRYVNNILIPSAENTSAILKYIRPVIDFERLEIDSVMQFVSEVRMHQSDHVVTLRGALLSPLEDGRRVYVFDVDCFSEQHDVKQLGKLLELFHESAQRCFLDQITEEYKNIMRGKA